MWPRYAFCLVLSAGLGVGCDLPTVTGPTSVTGSPLTASQESEHFSYRYAPGDVVMPERQEAHHAWALERLGLTVQPKITYHKYRDRAQLGAATGFVTNGTADVARFAVHTLWSFDNHEPIHVYTAAFGTPPALFNEGIAVALQTDPLVGDFDPKFNGQRLHAAAAAYRRQRQLPTLDQIIETSGFRAHPDPTLVYRQAGSFMMYLIEHEGLERVKAFFRASHWQDKRPVIHERFRATFTESLADAERAWLEVLESR